MASLDYVPWENCCPDGEENLGLAGWNIEETYAGRLPVQDTDDRIV